MAEGGDAEAQAWYAQWLLDGGRARAAFAWFNRAAAGGSAMGLNMVGRCYELGHGTAVDHARASECYRVAAARGLAPAMYNWGTSLALGRGTAEDRAAALGWFERAAAAGFAKADNYVGSFAEDGWAGPVDLARARACYARAAAGDDFRGCFNHARMLLADGRAGEARGWIDRALELGHDRFRAQVQGWLARHGEAMAC